MTGSGHEQWTDAAGAYLLHAMPSDEAEAYETHLAECSACRAEVERLRVAADALPASPIQYDPPPELKDRIMSIVNAEAELLRAAGARADEPEGEPSPRRRRFAVLRPGWWSLRPGLAVAGATAVLALGAVGGILAGSALRDGDAVRTVEVQTAVPGAEGELIVRDSGHSTLVTTGMPAAGKDRVYQVWLKRPGQDPQPTDALFDVRNNGSASVDVPGSLDDVEAVLVTSEPEGGSSVPTREPVMSASPA